jgi:hypothetical protein
VGSARRGPLVSEQDAIAAPFMRIGGHPVG